MTFLRAERESLRHPVRCPVLPIQCPPQPASGTTLEDVGPFPYQQFHKPVSIRQSPFPSLKAVTSSSRISIAQCPPPRKSIIVNIKVTSTTGMQLSSDHNTHATEEGHHKLKSTHFHFAGQILLKSHIVIGVVGAHYHLSPAVRSAGGRDGSPISWNQLSLTHLHLPHVHGIITPVSWQMQMSVPRRGSWTSRGKRSPIRRPLQLSPVSEGRCRRTISQTGIYVWVRRHQTVRRDESER